MASNERSVVYDAAFGFPHMAATSRMSTDRIFRIDSMIKLPTSRRDSNSTRGARQAEAGRADRQYRSDARSAQVLAGFNQTGSAPPMD
jgi:hypothetical protein